MSKTIYPGLLAKMKEKKETQITLSKLLEITRASINNKMLGKTDWTIGEVEKICKHYDSDYYELFKRKEV